MASPRDPQDVAINALHAEESQDRNIQDAGIVSNANRKPSSLTPSMHTDNGPLYDSEGDIGSESAPDALSNSSIASIQPYAAATETVVYPAEERDIGYDSDEGDVATIKSLATQDNVNGRHSSSDAISSTEQMPSQIESSPSLSRNELMDHLKDVAAIPEDAEIGELSARISEDEPESAQDPPEEDLPTSPAPLSDAAFASVMRVTVGGIAEITSIPDEQSKLEPTESQDTDFRTSAAPSVSSQVLQASRKSKTRPRERIVGQRYRLDMVDVNAASAETSNGPPTSAGLQIATNADAARPQDIPAFHNQDLEDSLRIKKDDEMDANPWHAMETIYNEDQYDDEGNLVAERNIQVDVEQNMPRDSFDDYEGMGGGYTRIQQDDGAELMEEIDAETKYLFDDEKAMTPLSQMQATKDLLTEGQRIAYVGLCKLTAMDMIKELKRGNIKELVTAIEAMEVWALKTMAKLYQHMEIEHAEQNMIEQLALHGVRAEDLAPTLMTTSTVPNVAYDPETAKKLANERAAEGDHASLDVATTTETMVDDLQSPEIHHSPRMIDSDEELSDSLLAAPQLTLDLRWTVLCDLFLVLISDSIYDSRSRGLLERVAEHLGIPWVDVIKFERRVTEALDLQEGAEQLKQDDIIQNRLKLGRNKRYMMMGLATLGGGLVIGLSAGLLAPVIGAGLGAAFTTIGIGGTTGFLAGTGGAALITTGGIVTGGSIAAKGMSKRTKSVKTFEYKVLHDNKRVSMCISINGWMAGKEDDVRLPFSTIDPVMGDHFTVFWEPEMLSDMGSALKILATEVITQVGQEILRQTLLAGLMAALSWPIMLTKLGYLIDNPWSNALDRARAAGLILADTLVHRHLGVRPVSLVGYSLGARVIFYCLVELSRMKAYGIVQDVFLFGAPITANNKQWREVSSVVSGRFVNGFNRADWILGYLFRATTGGLSTVAGLRPVEYVHRLENLDITHLVKGHMQYRETMPKLMREVGFVVTADHFDELEPDPEAKPIGKFILGKKGKKEIKRERQRERIREQEIEQKQEQKTSAFARLMRRKKVESKAQAEEYNEDDDDEESVTSSTSTEVLWDIDKIREELASEGVEVREIESTLPTLVMKSSDSGTLSSEGHDNEKTDSKDKSPIIVDDKEHLATDAAGQSSPAEVEQLQYEGISVREIKTTLPKLVCSPTSTPSSVSNTKFAGMSMRRQDTMDSLFDTPTSASVSDAPSLERDDIARRAMRNAASHEDFGPVTSHGLQTENADVCESPSEEDKIIFADADGNIITRPTNKSLQGTLGKPRSIASEASSMSTGLNTDHYGIESPQMIRSVSNPSIVEGHTSSPKKPSTSPSTSFSSDLMPPPPRAARFGGRR